MLLPDNQSSKDFAHEKHTKAPEGTTTGVAAGGTIARTLGLLAGIGALAIPGLGPFIAAGPIMGALAGLGVGGAVGGLVGAFVGMGMPVYEA
jgi:tetrahydromethanopterin S-methyltransferase subunit C